MCVVLVFFFFKQKTAYEIRISDWSSDVCSSDLASRVRRILSLSNGSTTWPGCRAVQTWCSSFAETAVMIVTSTQYDRLRRAAWLRSGSSAQHASSTVRVAEYTTRRPSTLGARRSEEHTSELQSLMRISYAVFCLNKKNNIH